MPRSRRSGCLRRHRTRVLPMRELVSIVSRDGNDVGDSKDRGVRAAIAVREQPAELVYRVPGIETHCGSVGANPRAGVQAARPVLEVVILERFQQLSFDAGFGRHLVQRNPAALTMSSKPSDELFLWGHGLHATETTAIPAPSSRVADRRRYCFILRDLPNWEICRARRRVADRHVAITETPGASATLTRG